jgi:WD40 repeat protein
VYVRKEGVAVRANEFEILAIDEEKTLPPVAAKWRGANPPIWFLGSQDSTFAIHGWSFVKMGSKPMALPEPGASPAPSVASVAGTPSVAPSPMPNAPLPSTPAAGSVLGLHEIARLADTAWGMKCLAISPDGKFVAGGKIDQTIWMFDVAKSAKVSETGRLEDMGPISVVAFTPQGDRLLAGGAKGKVTIWKVREGALVVDRSYVGHGNEVSVMRISPDGKFVLSGAKDERLRYWELDTSKEVYAWDGFQRGPKGVWISADGKLALATDGHSLTQLNLQDGTKEIRATNLANIRAQSAAFSPDGKTVAITDGQKLRRFQTEDGKELPLFDAKEMVWSVQFSPDARQIVTGGRAHFSIWDADGGKRIEDVTVSQFAYVRAIAIGNDGRRIAAIGDAAGQPLQVFETTQAK